MATMTESPLTVSAVALELGVSTGTVRRWILSGELQAVKLGRTRSAHYRVERAALERFLIPTSEGEDCAA
jgi:excisionase family DNA binding protein